MGRPKKPEAEKASRSGRSLSVEERRAAGRGQMFWRPRLEALADLDALAERWGLSRGEALERAVREAMERS